MATLLRQRAVRALCAALWGVLLTGLVMPDAPRPKRHDKSPITVYTEESRSSSSSTSARGGSTAQSRELQEQTNTHNQRDRSAKAILPSRRRN